MPGRLSLAVSIPLLAALLAVPIRAQDAGGAKPAHAAGKEGKAKGEKAAKAAHHDVKPDGNRGAGILHASRLFDAELVFADGRGAGKVADVVLDPSDGRIQYAVLDAGSFTDAQGKLSAVPVDALGADTASAQIKLVGIDKTALVAAPAFDKAEWPKDGDRDFVAKVWKQFGREPYWDDKATGFGTLRLSTLMKTTLHDAKGEELGQVDNFAVDLVHGKVLYAIVHPPASTNAGEPAGDKAANPGKAAEAQAERRVAVPWAVLAKGAASGKLVLDMDPARFLMAPSFAGSQWPLMSDGAWVASNDAFYSEAAAAR